MKILITSGGTKVPIDKVRHIMNMSTGTFGKKIAESALNYGHNVDFFYAENSKTPFTFNKNLFNKDINKSLLVKEFENTVDRLLMYGKKYNERSYSNFDTYMNGLFKYINDVKPDVIILAAAVSDYGVDNYFDGKVRSKDSQLTIQLKALPKIISKVRSFAATSYLVGFKLLVDSTDQELIENAQKSINNNGCDMVVANDLRDIKNNDHKLIIVKPNKEPITVKQTTDYYSLSNAIIEQIEQDKKI